MIVLRRLQGSRIGINSDQIERLDETPETVITLVNGNSYLVAETLDEVVDRIAEFKARTQGVRTAPTRSRRARRRSPHLQLAIDDADTPQED